MFKMVRIPLNFDVIIITHPFLEGLRCTSDVRFFLCHNERENAFLDHYVNKIYIYKLIN